MLELELKDNKVYYKNQELKINKQASKGPGNEVIWIYDCTEANGQKWISLSKLKEGINRFECKAKEVTKQYQLTKEEQEEVDYYQSKIDEIIENAKKRYLPKSKRLEDMTIEELEAYIKARKQ